MNMGPVPKADAYGAVLINASGEVLLREPSGHFGGYVWTFAKGRSDPGETPAQTALREVREETGYDAEILAVIPTAFPGTTTVTAFFLAAPIGEPGAFSRETASIRWVSFEAAAGLIALTKTSYGRQRDLDILEAARVLHATLDRG
jgi:8-oxo-dGTP diphosphatase